MSTIDELRGRGAEIQGEPDDEGRGITTTLVLPGALELTLYDPRYQRAF